ncbi:MAG: amino acid-binding ACT [Planctomycetes bacterium]|nr:amino acid-binding ACT [Planctomycetota bacterium]
MSFKWDRVQVWSVEVPDEPGSAAAKLAFLAQAGANLEYVEMQRLSDKSGYGIVYVAPVTGPTQVRAAKSAGFIEASSPVVRRIEGDNEAGLAHRLTQQWSMAGINLHGLTMTAVGHKFVGYATFDSVADANRAAQILADLGTASA